MQNLDKISEELFAKIRGRFPSVTIGTEEGMITNNPSEARFIEFDYKNKGKVSLSLSEDNGLVVMHGADILAGESESELKDWYNFLRELRQFAKKRLLNFDTRDITKSNLTKRDYNFLAKNAAGEDTMNESKLYGTSKVSYQNVDNARIILKHTESINQESATGRTQKIGKIYIESPEGERFKYPFKHLSGARAMARHVAEGGNAYDDFGKHIVGLSEELSKLRKFKTYMGRSAVMAESLAGYMDVVKERIATVKKTIESLQKPAYYKETFESFNPPVLEDVPSDVAENWIDELTIKQFNEELQDIFPYIYNLVKEGTKAVELGPDDLLGEAHMAGYEKYHCKDCGCQMHNCKPDCNCEHDSHDETGSWWRDENGNGVPDIMEADSPGIAAMKKAGNAKADAEAKERKKKKAKSVDEELEDTIEELMGQFSESNVKAIIDMIANADDPEQMVMDLIDKDGPEGKFLYGELEQLATEKGKTFNDGETDPAELVPELLANMGIEEGNAYAHAVRQAKMNGAKKGDKIDHPDDDEDDITIEKDQKTPLGEFILSYYDRETGSFPKGETAILTMVEKDYGDNYVKPAMAFIEKVHETFVTHERMNQEQNDILALAGM